MSERCKGKILDNHPCFHAEACSAWGRIHLPVAPHCNIQCNFCNRLYDCVNESRPGVTGQVLEPAEAVEALDRIMEQRSDIAVVGIAGPGDPLCDAERTLQTLQAVHVHYPELMLCVSTNGLNLLPYIDALAEVGVTHITVTVNAVKPSVAQHIYAFIREKGRTYTGLEGAELLLQRQQEGLLGLKRHDFIVKMNTVVLPGINMAHIPDIVTKAAFLGVDVMNCMPVIPVAGTPFAGIIPPTAADIEKLRQSAGKKLRQISHCRRCRADAVGLLPSQERLAVGK